MALDARLLGWTPRVGTWVDGLDSIGPVAWPRPVGAVVTGDVLRVRYDARPPVSADSDGLLDDFLNLRDDATLAAFAGRYGGLLRCDVCASAVPRVPSPPPNGDPAATRRYLDAESAFRRAAGPDLYAQVHALERMGRWDEAEAALRGALARERHDGAVRPPSPRPADFHRPSWWPPVVPGAAPPPVPPRTAVEFEPVRAWHHAQRVFRAVLAIAEALRRDDPGPVDAWDVLAAGPLVLSLSLPDRRSLFVRMLRRWRDEAHLSPAPGQSVGLASALTYHLLVAVERRDVLRRCASCGRDYVRRTRRGLAAGRLNYCGACGIRGAWRSERRARLDRETPAERDARLKRDRERKRAARAAGRS